MRFKRPTFLSTQAEHLEDRRVLSANPLDLDLSSVPTQSVFAGETISFNLVELGAVINEGDDGPREVLWQLDPDLDERPEGVSISLDGEFQWTPSEDQEGLHSIRIIVVENGMPRHADVESLMIQVKLGRPDLDLNPDTEGSDFSAVFQVGYGPVSPTGTEVSISDEDGDTIYSATITLTNHLDGDAEILSVDTTDTNITASYEDGVLTLTGEDSHENYEKVLASLQYENTNPEADPSTRIIEFTINDGEYDSHVATATVVINHPPDLLPIPDQVVELGSSHTVEISANDFNSEDELFFLLEVGTPDFITLTHEEGSRDATIHINPPSDLEMESLRVRVLVVDQNGLADVQAMNITFTVAENTAPTISKIKPVKVPQDGESGLIDFIVGDAETDPADLVVTAESNRPNLIGPDGIILGGEGENRTIQVIPNAGAYGAAKITLTVSDGELTKQRSFIVIVKKGAENTPPTITPMEDLIIPQDGESDPVEFTVGDAQTDPADLVVTAESDNADLVAEDGIIIAGEGENRTIQIVPVAGASGTATITVSVSDGDLTTTETFMVTVEEVAENTAPTISELGDLTLPVDGESDAIAFTVGDAETDPADLVVIAESDNTDLVAEDGIIIAGEGENRTIQIVPVAGASGTATITVSVSDGDLTTTETFMVTVEEVAENTAPTISELGDLTLPVDGESDAIAFTVGDAETDPADLVVTAESDNADLVAEDGIIIAGEGENRTIQIVPVAGASGTATITVSVSDGDLTTTATFMVTVEAEAENTAPTIGELGDITLPVDGESDLIEFVVGDAETDPADLVVTAESDNADLIAEDGVIIAGEGENRTIQIIPVAGASGTATITVSVSDGELTTTATFMVTVEAEVENTAPTISEIGDVLVPADGESGAIEFTVGDAETDPADLVVTATSSDANLIGEAGLVIAGEGENRTITIIPTAGLVGDATITVTVSDGELTTSTTFLVSVTLANIPPTISDIADITIPVDGESEVIEFTVNDEETAPGELFVQASSDNEALIASGDLVLGGEGENRTLVISPQAGVTGTATITVSVSDGSDFTETTFVVTVSEVEVAAPEAQDDAYSTTADTSLSISAAGVLENDDAGDNGPLSISEVNGEANGVGEMVTLDSGAQLRLNADGSFDYHPDGAFADLPVGEVYVDSFTYTAVDGEGNVTSAMVEITVEGILSGTDPVANDDTYYTDASTALTITTSGVMNNDVGEGLVVTEVNGEAAAVGTSVALDSGALLKLNADGSLTYDPNGKFGDVVNGSPATDSFAYTVVDAHGVEATAMVLIMVEAPNDEGDLNLPPINTIPGQQETDWDGSIVFTPDNGNGISVSDADAGNAIIETTISVDNGLLTLNGGFSSSRHKLVGTIEQLNNLLNGLTYDPPADFVGTVTFTIYTNDLGNSGAGGPRSDTDQFLILVSAPENGGGIIEEESPETAVDAILAEDDDLLADAMWS